MACQDDQVLTIRQNDRLPVLTAVAYAGGVVKPLDTFTSIVFRMKHRTTGAVVTGAATGDAAGNLLYSWAAGDTAVVGIYDAVFVATDVTGRVMTFPTKYNLVVEVIKSV